ncbi:N-acetylglutamate synthase-like GNAT family acetyltransferase [Stella humosa]|uniref:N-acetylglutamate synthase-like GNAT family acetyltransferase n=1 Tax=Stella humosa TaxID=94 RepID=A0A3N1M301_9PROT|nr:GNAT family N-acetyltransferase [Stella humosa]ROQ00092.1 N-acetylglutamate synthase-like GNAT family acetyltransferase [Stella humosa]BBK30673.1 N-acetyltransferase GCN5 [Stella humosa]
MTEPATQPVTIRRAQAADAGAVRALTRAAYARWVPLIGREPMPMRADYEHAVRAHLVDLLFVGDELAGLIEMIDEGDHLLVENVAIAPDRQGHGHGRTLLDHAEQVAASLGRPEMRLYTNKAFAGNVAFYGRRGYAIDREEPFKEGFTVYMSKRLPAPPGPR